ncbi:MAG: ABC transporter substrate-binding protein [Spirochaetaceae bacterium]|jgi:NitT/TauT family transport system substrate-binding protein|nr:ABC transporter substrate-binding protein [Spirochaetaceae bacterium]
MKVTQRLVFLLLLAFSTAGGGASLLAAPLRVGIFLDIDSMPLLVARDEGFFTREGVVVELVIFQNPQERDAALQAGRLDGAVSDLLAAAFFAAAGFDYKITSLTDGRYGIVGSPLSENRSLAGLRGRRIALSTNTIIQYTVDTLFEEAGIPRGSYEAISTPRMPLRLELVLSGQVDAAGLPDPLLSAAVARGAPLLAQIDTSDAPPVDPGVILFSKQILDTRLEEVRRFYRAFYRAALKINAAQESYREYLVEKMNFPGELKESYRFISYRRPSLPDPSQLERVFAWLTERKLLAVRLRAAELLDSRPVNGLGIE